MEARRKINIQPRVIAEIPKAQMGQMHAVQDGLGQPCGRGFLINQGSLGPECGSRPFPPRTIPSCSRV
jgi:hypothetical protein